MKSRVFLVALVMFLLLINAAFSQVVNATIFSGGELFGLIPYWELKESLPCGIFAAAALVAALGIGAQFWGGLLPACGAGEWVPSRRFMQFATAGVWCAWPLLGACLAVAGFLFPWAADGAQGELWYQSRTALMLQMGGALILLAGLRMVQGFRSGKAGLPDALFAALVALSCGLLWWEGRALDFLAVALIAPLALALLLAPPARQKHRVALGWLLAAALALGTYACGTQHLMASYLPGAEAWRMLTICCAVLAAVLALALALVPALRRNSCALRVVAAAALLLLLGYNWDMLASHVLMQHPLLLLTCPAPWVGFGIYLVALAAMGGLAWLRHWR